MSRPPFAAVLVATALTGCGTWTHPTKPAAAYDVDRNQCNASAIARFPVALAQRIDKPGYIEPGRSSCTNTGNTTNCVNYPPREVPPTYITYDTNENRRSEASDSCVRAAGWTYKLRD